VPINVDKLAEQLRRDLKRAGVTREKLFERSATRQPIRAHDLRATFVTIALATGKSETWVADRTGHKSSTMINRYRRKARGWNVGTLDALDIAIPELTSSAVPRERPTGGGPGPKSGRVDREKDDEYAIPLQATGTDGAFKTAALDHSATPPDGVDLAGSQGVENVAAFEALRKRRAPAPAEDRTPRSSPAWPSSPRLRHLQRRSHTWKPRPFVLMTRMSEPMRATPGW
jgi:hypothetical protein